MIEVCGILYIVNLLLIIKYHIHGSQTKSQMSLYSSYSPVNSKVSSSLVMLCCTIMRTKRQIKKRRSRKGRAVLVWSGHILLYTMGQNFPRVSFVRPICLLNAHFFFKLLQCVMESKSKPRHWLLFQTSKLPPVPQKV